MISAYYVALILPTSTEHIIQYTSSRPRQVVVDECMSLVTNHFTVRKLNANLIVLDEHAAIMMPIYLELLESDVTPRNTKACILAEVRRQNQIDRSSFILVCHDLLRSKNIRGAMQLLAEIGTEYDTAPLHILLMDEADIIRIEACETIGKIGGKKDVIAIDLWLRSARWHDDKERVQKMRDELAGIPFVFGIGSGGGPVVMPFL